MSALLLGLGTATPAGTLSRSASIELAAAHCARDERDARLLATIHRRSRIESRGVSLVDATGPGAAHGPARDAADGLAGFYPPSSPAAPQGPGTARRMEAFARHGPALAAAACRRALQDARVAPSDVTHLIVVTCTGFSAPGVDVSIIKRLGLSRTVGRTQIGFMGCHAALNALRVADAIVRADAGVRVLLCCVELCSLHFQYGWDAQQVVANTLFADGAAAVVLGGREEEAGAEGAERAEDRGPWRLEGTASCLIEDTEDHMAWEIGDHGFRMSLSPRVPDAVARHLRPWLDDWVAGHGRRLETITGWAIHAGGPRIVQAVGERLGLAETDLAASRDVLRRHGNMSSATVLFVLERLRPVLAAGDACAVLAFGPGLTAEAALLTRCYDARPPGR